MIALLYSIIMILFIGQYHWAFGLLAAAAYLVVGVVVPLTASKLSGDSGMRFRSDSGELGAFLCWTVCGGWTRSLDYGAGEDRLAEMDRRTDELAETEERMKKKRRAQHCLHQRGYLSLRSGDAGSCGRAFIWREKWIFPGS